MGDPPREAPPRLRRSRSDRVIAGVAGGIAEYVGADPILIRLAFIVLALAGGGGVLIYLIAWLIVPEADTEAAPTRARGGTDPETARLFIGGALIAIGGIILAGRFIPHFMVVFWPLVLIGAGVAVLAGVRR